MDPIVAVFAILGVAVAAFISNALPLGVIAIGVSLALYLTGTLELGEALAGFGDPTVLFIAALFVVSEALQASGVIAWAGEQVVARAGTRRVPLAIVLCLMTAGITALISVNGAVAALLPLVVVVATRAGIAPSQMLLPMAFSAHAGSLLALTGTPVNILVSDAMVEAGEDRVGFFSFALAGLPLLAGTLLLILWLGPRLLPERQAPSVPVDVQRLASLLRREYELSPGQGEVSANRGVTEVVIPPRSALIGLHVFPGMCTPSGELIILAARRGNEPLRGPRALLRAGDALLLDGSWDDLSLHTADEREVLVVQHPEKLRRSIPIGTGAKRTIAVTAAMLLALVTGVVPPAVAGLLAACALILLRVISSAQAYRAVSWSTIILVAGMIPLSTAFQSTGAAELIANWMLTVVGDHGTTVALAMLVLLTMTLGQLISNMATVLIMIPIAVALAAAIQVSPVPFLMALTVAGAASFVTPFATPANLMVLEPGQYRFGDYARFGMPFMALFFAVAVFWVPVVWPFSPG